MLVSGKPGRRNKSGVTTNWSIPAMLGELKPFRDVEVARVHYLTVDDAQRLINASNPEFRPLGSRSLTPRPSELTRRLEVMPTAGSGKSRSRAGR